MMGPRSFDRLRTSLQDCQDGEKDGNELPVIRKLDREMEALCFQDLDGGLEIVLAFAGNADGIALDLRLHLHLLLLNQLGDDFGLLRLQSGFNLDHLAKAGISCGFHFLVIEGFHGNAALYHLLVQRFGEGAELHVVRSVKRDRFFLRIPVDRGVRSFEIVSLVDLLTGLINSVIDLLLIDFGNDIE
jgi:hypothetical protein